MKPTLIDLNKNGRDDLQEPHGQAAVAIGDAFVKTQLEEHPHTLFSRAWRKVGGFLKRLFGS